MKKIKRFPSIVETSYDESKTVHSYVRFGTWYWITRFSTIFVITPLFPITVIIYIIFYYGQSLAKRDEGIAVRDGAELIVSGSKKSFKQPYSVTIVRSNSSEVLTDLEANSWFKKALVILKKIVIVVLILFALMMVLFYINTGGNYTPSN